MLLCAICLALCTGVLQHNWSACGICFRMWFAGSDPSDANAERLLYLTFRCLHSIALSLSLTRTYSPNCTLHPPPQCCLFSLSISNYRNTLSPGIRLAPSVGVFKWLIKILLLALSLTDLTSSPSPLALLPLYLTLIGSQREGPSLFCVLPLI